MKIYTLHIIFSFLAISFSQSAFSSIPKWFGAISQSPTEIVFYGEGPSLALAKVSALADLNIQLSSSVHSTISSSTYTLNDAASRHSSREILISSTEIDLPNIDWQHNEHIKGSYYIAGKISRSSLIDVLIRGLQKDTQQFSFGGDMNPSFKTFFYYMSHQKSIDDIQKKILLLNGLCANQCENTQITHWIATYTNIIEFPKLTCLKPSDEMNEVLSVTLEQFFNQMGFVGNQLDCYLFKATTQHSYYKKDNLRWAEGWLLVKFFLGTSEKMSGKVSIK